MNDKIKQVLTIKQLSPSQLADEIGVQRSSISHILSGRNRPSLDIIQKIVRCYPDLSYEWFLDDDLPLSIATERGSRTQPIQPRSMVDPIEGANPNQQRVTARSAGRAEPKEALTQPIIPKQEDVVTGKQIDRILIFYNDGTFLEYKPA